MRTLKEKAQSKTKKVVYSYENQLAEIFAGLSDNQLVEKLFSLQEERRYSTVELHQDKISQAIKMCKRELYKRDLGIAA